jgi:hypothetical protein
MTKYFYDFSICYRGESLNMARESRCGSNFIYARAVAMEREAL